MGGYRRSHIASNTYLRDTRFDSCVILTIYTSNRYRDRSHRTRYVLLPPASVKRRDRGSGLRDQPIRSCTTLVGEHERHLENTAGPAGASQPVSRLRHRRRSKRRRRIGVALRDPNT